MANDHSDPERDLRAKMAGSDFANLISSQRFKDLTDSEIIILFALIAPDDLKETLEQKIKLGQMVEDHRQEIDKTRAKIAAELMLELTRRDTHGKASNL